MHRRILCAILFFAGADGAFLRPWAAVTPDANSTDANSAQVGKHPQRVPVCRFCQKLCPINCFVGTCGLHLPYSVERYEGSNQCYSCDPAVSVGINKDGDYLKCEAEESGMVITKSGASASPYTQQQTIQQGPQGPAVPGDAGLSALKASKEAQLAVAAATKAAIFANQAAEAATAKYRQATVSVAAGGVNDTGDGQSVTSIVDQAENHQIATQIRVEECLRVAEAEHTSWKAAMDKYNQEVEKLRRQQLLVDMAEKTLEAAEAASEKARGQCSTYQAEAQRAVEEAMKKGGPLSTRILSQAASEELAGAAMAAHRRLVIAAKEAKEASEKISIASAMAPCATPGSQVSIVSGSGSVTGTAIANAGGTTQFMSSTGATVASTSSTSAAFVAGTGATVGVYFTKALMQVPQKAPMPPVAPASFAMASFTGLEGAAENAGFDEQALPMEGQLTMPSVAQEMSESIVNKLTDNPASVNDASLFALPTVPFSSDQVPGNGMTLQPMPSTDNLVSLEEASTDPSLLKLPAVSLDRTIQPLPPAADSVPFVWDSNGFAAPMAALSPEQVPVYGMMQTPGFDPSTISALQKSERRLLRQGGAHH